jgi:hypothetical protein
LSDIVLAAEDRYSEAEELLLLNRCDACVYLLGYAVEMWLKAACLRLHFVPPNASVKASLPALKRWMKIVAPTVVPVDYHDLRFWTECLLQLRLSAGRPVSPALAAELQRTIAVDFYAEWIVDMRYRRSGLTVADAVAALDQAWWIRTNWAGFT